MKTTKAVLACYPASTIGSRCPAGEKQAASTPTAGANAAKLLAQHMPLVLRRTVSVVGLPREAVAAGCPPSGPEADQ